MKSTGVYWKPIFYVLEDAVTYVLAMSQQHRRFGGADVHHIRGEAATLEDAVKEAIRIGEESEGNMNGPPAAVAPPLVPVTTT